MAYLNNVAAQQNKTLARIMPNRYGQPAAQPAQQQPGPLAPTWAQQPNTPFGQSTATAAAPAATAVTPAAQPAQPAGIAPTWSTQAQPGGDPWASVASQQPVMPSGASPNPWLAQQAQGISTNLTNTFQNTVAPAIRGGAISAGGYGGSRQGVAEGLALQGLGRDIANAQANLFGQAYESDANRANALQMATMQNQLGYAGLSNQKDIAGMNNSTTRDVASMNNQTTQRGQDLSNSLGYAGLQNTKDIATMNNATTQQGQNLNYQLGMTNANNTYNLGVANNALGYDRLALDTNNANAANNLSGAQFGLDIYKTLLAGDQKAVDASTALQNLPVEYQKMFTDIANSIGKKSGTTTGTQTAEGDALMAAISAYILANSTTKA